MSAVEPAPALTISDELIDEGLDILQACLAQVLP